MAVSGGGGVAWGACLNESILRRDAAASLLGAGGTQKVTNMDAKVNRRKRGIGLGRFVNDHARCLAPFLKGFFSHYDYVNRNL